MAKYSTSIGIHWGEGRDITKLYEDYFKFLLDVEEGSAQTKGAKVVNNMYFHSFQSVSCLDGIDYLSYYSTLEYSYVKVGTLRRRVARLSSGRTAMTTAHLVVPCLFLVSLWLLMVVVLLLLLVMLFGIHVFHVLDVKMQIFPQIIVRDDPPLSESFLEFGKGPIVQDTPHNIVGTVGQGFRTVTQGMMLQPQGGPTRRTLGRGIVQVLFQPRGRGGWCATRRRRRGSGCVTGMAAVVHLVAATTASP